MQILQNRFGGNPRFTQAPFMEKMAELDERETILNNKKTVITEDILRQLFGMFKSYVAEKNIPEIKKSIGSYVEKVIVYKEHVDVIFKLKIVDLLGGGGGIRTPVSNFLPCVRLRFQVPEALFHAVFRPSTFYLVPRCIIIYWGKLGHFATVGYKKKTGYLGNIRKILFRFCSFFQFVDPQK